MNNSKLVTLPIDESSYYGSSTYAPLWKIALLLATGISCHYSLTPPNLAKAKTVVVKKTFFEKAVQWFTFCSKTIVWMMTLSDAAATYSTAYHHAPASLVCSHRPATRFTSISPHPPFLASPHPLLTVSPLLLVGACSVIFANLLRQWCFRKLGPLFTFEISIQPNHRLVTTGPYAIVRHPSYIGIYLTLLGASAIACAPGSWLRECWFPFACTGDAAQFAFGLPSVGQVVVCLLLAFWCAKCSIVFKSTYKRLHIEDRELKKVFGETWEAYARQVRWRILPGIY